MSIPADIIVVEEGDLSPEQAGAFLQLAIQCFPDVTAEEVEEDFCRPPVARVLAYSQGELVAGAEVFEREVEYMRGAGNQYEWIRPVYERGCAWSGYRHTGLQKGNGLLDRTRVRHSLSIR